jgi:hypothetical protein
MATRSPKQKAAMAAAVERPDAGQGLQDGRRARELAAVQVDHLLRAAVQVARAAVVAQAAPQAQHVVQRRGGEGTHVGKRCRNRS